jgi:ABC-type Na+ transport system ATPase subunit NatA
MLVVEHVSKEYGRAASRGPPGRGPALSDSFSVGAARCCPLANGAGKTTLLKIITTPAGSTRAHRGLDVRTDSARVRRMITS